MRIVDGHIHVLDASWVPEGVRRAWARQAAGRRHPERDPDDLYERVSQGQSDPEGELTVAALDRCGVAAAVIPVVDWTIVGRPCGTHLPIRDLHRRNHELGQRWPGRLFHCAGLDPRHPDAAAIAEEAERSPWCVGTKLYPAAGWQLEDPDHAWVFARAEEAGRPLVVHTSPLGGDPLVTPNSRPAALAPLLARHPEVTWVFAHAGFEAWWAEAVDIASGWRRVFLDVSLWQGTAARDHAEFRRRMAVAVERVGAHRIIFGSDIIRGPHADPDGAALARWIDWFCALAEPWKGEPAVLSHDELELALAGSAIDAYGLEEADLRG